jgi:hypothetical protein
LPGEKIVADVQINQLPAAATLAGTEVIPADQGATTVKVTVASLTAAAVAAVPVYDLDAAVVAAPDVSPLDATTHFLLHDTTALGSATVQTLIDALPKAVPQIPVYIEWPIAGAAPTRPELAAAFASVPIPLSANADAYIRDASGQSKLFRVSFRKDAPTQNPAGDFYWIKMDGPV